MNPVAEPMTRRQRLLWHVLLPTPLAALMMLAAYGRGSPAFFVAGWLLYALTGYVIAGLPSLAYAWLMEVLYRSGVWPGSGRALVWSGVFGALVAAGLFVVPELFTPHALRSWAVEILGIGFATGALTEAVIRWRMRTMRSAPISDP